MVNVFLKVLNMSLTAGWLILTVILIRLLFKRMPKSVRCLLWALVAVRLICPFSLESSLSLIPSTETIAPEVLYDTRPEISSGIEMVDKAINPVFSESFASDPAASANPLQIWTIIGANLWILGILAMSIYVVFSCWKIRCKVQVSVETEKNIWICDEIDTPFILGVFRPRIYIPSSLEEENYQYVIAHEKAHVRRRDHWWKPLGYLFLMVYWFHPLMWIAYILFCRDIELACDERVIKDMSSAEKKAYSTALLLCSTSRHQVAACPLAFGETGVKQRIYSILHYRKPTFWMILLAIVICIAAAIGFLTDPKSDNEWFGAAYSVKEILYQAPQYSFTYTLETTPEYTLTSDHILMRRSGMGGTDAWTDVGGLKEVDYSRTERYEFFDPLNNKAHEVLDQVKRCWRADTYNETDTFYLLMETRKEKLLLAVGHGDKVRWLWELQKESGTYDYEDLEQKIQGKRDDAVQIFSLYQVEQTPSHLLIGYESKDDTGLATFVYDEKNDEYILKARRDFGNADLYNMTIQQEARLNQSITAVISRRVDLAEVTAAYADEVRSQGVSVCPALIVFEWGEILPGDAIVDVKFYNAASKEIYRMGESEAIQQIKDEVDNPLILMLPENSNWIQDPEVTEMDEKRGMLQYYDGIMEEELTLLYGTESPLLVLENMSYDEEMTENWDAWTKNGDHVLIRLQFAGREDGNPFVCAEWNYNGMYYAIYGVIDKDADASPIAKTAINIVQHLGEE